MLTIHYSISGKITYEIKIYTSGHLRFIPPVTGVFMKARMADESVKSRTPETGGLFLDIRHIMAALRAGMCKSKTKTNMQMT